MTSLTNHLRSKALLVMSAVGAGAAYARKRGERLVGRKDVYCVVVNRPAKEVEPGPGRFAQPLADIARHAKPELHPAQAGRGTQRPGVFVSDAVPVGWMAADSARATESLITMRVLRHLQRVDDALVGLARPLGLPPASDSAVDQVSQRVPHPA